MYKYHSDIPKTGAINSVHHIHGFRYLNAPKAMSTSSNPSSPTPNPMVVTMSELLMSWLMDALTDSSDSPSMILLNDLNMAMAVMTIPAVGANIKTEPTMARIRPDLLDGVGGMGGVSVCKLNRSTKNCANKYPYHHPQRNHQMLKSNPPSKSRSAYTVKVFLGEIWMVFRTGCLPPRFARLGITAAK